MFGIFDKQNKERAEPCEGETGSLEETGEADAGSWLTAGVWGHQVRGLEETRGSS